MKLKSKIFFAWNGFGAYLFCLGLFNFFLLLSALGLFFVWCFFVWWYAFESCRCGLKISFLFWSQWTPEILTWSYLQNWFLFYFVLCLSEVGFLTWKSKQSQPRLFRWYLLLLWGVRVLMRNLSGLLLLLSMLVKPYARGIYLGLGFFCLFFLFQGQRGTWSGLNLNTLPTGMWHHFYLFLCRGFFWLLLIFILAIVIPFFAGGLFEFFHLWFLPFRIFVLLLLVLSLFGIYRFKKIIFKA